MAAFRNDFAERIGVDADSIDGVLEILSDYVWGQVSDEGRCTIPGFGSFFLVDGRRLFEPATDLSRVVNHKYVGLSALAVDDSGAQAAVSDSFDDFDDSDSDSEFAPRWEGQMDSDEASGADRSETPAFEETSLVPGEEQKPESVDSEQLLSSFLGLQDNVEDSVDSPVTPIDLSKIIDSKSNLGKDVTASGNDDRDSSVRDALSESADDNSTLDIALPEEIENVVDTFEEVDLGDSLAPTLEVTDEVDADVDTPASKVTKVIVPIDENAEPVVEKRKQKRSPWLYALPILAIAFIVLGVLWVENRSNSPRPIVTTPEQTSEIEAAVDDQIPPDVVDPTGETQESTPETTQQTPGNGWKAGAINLADGGWTIVVSSEPSRAEAEAVASNLFTSLSNTPLPVDILESQVTGLTRYRVAVGQYRSSTVAQRDIDFLGSRLPQGSWALRLTENM